MTTPRRIYEDDRPPDRLLRYYTAAAVVAGLTLRIMLPWPLAPWVAVGLLVLSTLAVTTACFYHLRYANPDRLAVLAWASLANGAGLTVCVFPAGGVGVTVAEAAFGIGLALAAGTFLLGVAWMPLVERWLRQRRVFVSAGLCPRCGYDLTGSPAGRCPECGWRSRPGGSGDIGGRAI